MNWRQVFIVLGCAYLFISQANAHAFLDHAEPKVGSSVSSSPSSIKAWFTQRLVLPFSNLQVFDEKGREVDRKDKKLDPANEALLAVSIPALPPGRYKVLWRAVSVDTHVTTGTFAFTVTP